MSRIQKGRSSGRIKARPARSQRTRIAQRNLTFGLYLLDQKRNVAPALDMFCKWIGERLGAKVVPEQVPNYETLGERLEHGGVDLAWLPPVVYLRASPDVVIPLLALARGGKEGGYETALIVRADSKAKVVEDLRGASIGWVDAWSAAGYVIPRLSLRLGGVDPKSLFGLETFYGTHSAAVSAVLDGEVDVCATYARTDGKGNVIEGAWSEKPGARIRALMTFGEIPPDVIVATAGVPESIRVTLKLILEAASRSRSLQPILRSIFGTSGFGPVNTDGYDGLRAALTAESPPPSGR